MSRTRPSCSTRSARQLLLERAPRVRDLRQRVARLRGLGLGLRPLGCQGFALAPQVVALDVELRQRDPHAIDLVGRVLDGVTERGGGVGVRVDVAAGGVDVEVEHVDAALRLGVLLRGGGEPRGGVVAIALRRRPRRPGAIRAARRAGSRRASRSRISVLDLGGARGQPFGLLLAELLLVLPRRDVELAGVRVLTQGRRALIGFGQLDPQARQVRLELGEAGGGYGFALARVGEPCSRALDGRGQLAVAAHEQHLFPSPQLVAQPLVAPGLGGLTLQRAALLLDLEDDVVDARQVLLRGLELELGRAAARLVLGDAGRFLDQLPAIGRPRAEDHPNLALLDDRVGLGAEARVHQQFVDVAEPAHFAVDQVFAVARAVEPARDFDVAGEDAGEVLERLGARASDRPAPAPAAWRDRRRAPRSPWPLPWRR